jgi:hypothetical protein
MILLDERSRVVKGQVAVVTAREPRKLLKTIRRSRSVPDRTVIHHHSRERQSWRSSAMGQFALPAPQPLQAGDHLTPCGMMAWPGRCPGSKVYFWRMSQGSSAPTLDPELTAVRRAFDTAFQRMCEVTDRDELRDELSNLLHHLYRLGELRSRRWGTNGQKLAEGDFNARVTQVPGVLGILWIRSYDTHEIAAVSKFKDVYSDFYTKMYGVLVWQCIADMAFVKLPNAADRYMDYQSNLENKPVLDTLRSASDGLAALT